MLSLHLDRPGLKLLLLVDMELGRRSEMGVLSRRHAEE